MSTTKKPSPNVNVRAELQKKKKNKRFDTKSDDKKRDSSDNETTRLREEVSSKLLEHYTHITQVRWRAVTNYGNK